jgi:hypothetical protein
MRVKKAPRPEIEASASMQYAALAEGFSLPGLEIEQVFYLDDIDRDRFRGFNRYFLLRPHHFQETFKRRYTKDNAARAFQDIYRKGEHHGQQIHSG